MIRAIRYPFALGILLAAGCNVLPPPTEDMTRNFVLTTETPTAEIPSSGISVGLQRVEVASYLQHRDIVVRNGENEILYKDLDRWAEPIDAGVARIVQSKLLASSKMNHVYLAPFPLESTRDFDVSISVLRCEGAKTGATQFAAQFSAVVEIHKHTDSGDSSVARLVFKAEDKAWDGHDYARLVALLSADCEELGQSVADSLAAQH